MSKKSKKKQLIVKVREPYFIHKTLESGAEMTIMVGKYALPWKAITNVPICGPVMAKIEKVKKTFPDAHIEFNFRQENPAFIFNVSSKTIRHEGDTPDQSVGDKVARAKTLCRACVISKAIALAAKEGLEEELNRAIAVLDVWREKNKNVIKGV